MGFVEPQIALFRFDCPLLSLEVVGRPWGGATHLGEDATHLGDAELQRTEDFSA